LQSARACFGSIFQKLTTRAAPALAMAVQRLKQLCQQPREAWVNPLPRTLRTRLHSAPLRHVVSCRASGQDRGPQQDTAWAPSPRVFNRERLSVVRVRRAEVRLSATISLSLGVAKRPSKASEVIGCIRAI
jgi:hypothetical protein